MGLKRSNPRGGHLLELSRTQDVRDNAGHDLCANR